MSNEPAPKQQQQQSKIERTPIAIERLLIAHANANGVRLPSGPNGASDKMVHTVKAGTEGDIKTEIEFRPWMRAFRIALTRKVSRTVDALGVKRETVTWEPMGKPFFIHETWATWIPVEDL